MSEEGMGDRDFDREALRQQALLKALWNVGEAQALEALLRAPQAALTQRGLQAYVANAGAASERALATAFPTVQALVGEEAFAGLARSFWRHRPPARGDLAQLGHALPGFIEDDERLADVPYLADVARLDWAVAQAESAADAQADPQSLALLAQAEPSTLRFELAPGWAVLSSIHPVVTLWQVHRDPEGDFEAAGRAVREGLSQTALVWREGWRAMVQEVPAHQVAWTRALARKADIGAALEEAGEGFAFEAWLIEALRQGWVLGVRPL